MSELHLRIAVFSIAFAILASFELSLPKRQMNDARRHRWLGSWTIFLIGALLSRLLVPGGLTALALWAEPGNIGLLNLVKIDPIAGFVIAIIILDFAVWLQHYLSHKIPFVWRCHRVHHSDVHVDVTTAIRFHPIEILISILWKAVFVLGFGFSALAVLWFEIILNASAQFNHSNIRVPRNFDRILRILIVTPDMHRVHHSIEHTESNKNFGFFLSVWDRLLGTYEAQPELGHQQMTVGQSLWREPKDQNTISLLLQPLKRSD